MEENGSKDYPHIQVWKKRTRWAWQEYAFNGEERDGGEGFVTHKEAIRAAMGDADSTSLPLYIEGEV